MRNSTKYLAGPLLGALLTVTLVTGCTSSNEQPTPSGSPTASSSSTPTASATQPAAPVEAGATVAPDQALPENAKAYALPDGTTVAVVKDQPLPAPVQAAVDAGATAAVPVSSDGLMESAGPAMDAARDYAKEAQSSTGKKVVVVYQFSGKTGPEIDAPVVAGWQATSSANNLDGSFTANLDETLAVVQRYIASQTNPNDWAVVVRR